MPIEESPLEAAAKSGDVSQVRDLLDQGADPFEADAILGMTPLTLAILKEHLGVVKELVDRFPDLVHVKDRRNATPLHAAAASDSVDIAQVLLKNGAMSWLGTTAMKHHSILPNPR